MIKANAKQPYNPVAPSDTAGGGGGDAHDEENHNHGERYCGTIRSIGMGFGGLYGIGSIFYAQHCAQVLANETHGTVVWSPQLAAIFATFALLSQVMLVSIPFQKRLQTPILRRYKEEGYHIVGRVLRREVKQQKGKDKFFKVGIGVSSIPR